MARLLEHLNLAASATVIAVLAGVPMGILALRWSPTRSVLLGGTSLIQTIPSLALLTLLLPIFGIGTLPAILALVLYALLPIVRNTYTGLNATPPAMLEMADALGMTRFQRLRMVETRFAATFILAGVRTAATVSIGIATLSAFVGAGGLGTFINRGLALNNMNLVLLGAIPAGLVALYVDWLLGIFENGLKPRKHKGPLIAHGIVAIAVGTLAFVGLWFEADGHRVPATSNRTAGRIVVGSKNFTEQLILGELVAQLLERSTNLKVERKLNLAGTAVCHQALISGDIDVYPEYSGTALISVLKSTAPEDSDAAWSALKEQYAKRFDLKWLPPLGFANTYALAVHRGHAEARGWHEISDLRKDAKHLRGGFTSEFLEREDGYPGLSKRYGLKLGSTVDMDPSLMYQAARDSKVDVISAFSTDGRIAAFNLQVLEDDQHFFPPYDAALVVRGQTLEKYPEVEAALTRLSGTLSAEAMQKLNLAVDRDRKLPRDVAKQFLLDAGLSPNSD